MKETAYLQIASRRLTLRKELTRCCLCPRQCKVDRTAGRTGFCGLDDRLYCFREMIYDKEEGGLSPSHQVYFAGCNLRCAFCSVGEWNQAPTRVPTIKMEDLPRRIETRKRQGAMNLNLLGGEPLISVYGILELLEKLPPDTSVVWNSNMYFSEPVRHAIEGLADLFLADYKCDSGKCCEKMLGAGDYTHVVRSNIKWASKSAGLLIRHVVMPGHFECCSEPILEWIARNVPAARVSLRADYIPPIPAGDCPADYLDPKEYQKLLELANHLHLLTV
ncbi:MAG: radical SAM protein [Planctomycetaceae bacterium]|nr:radical SAM protein [Planctomycetaceae bacterium]